MDVTYNGGGIVELVRELPLESHDEEGTVEDGDGVKGEGRRGPGGSRG